MALFIFDYDGTLSDSVAVICECMTEAFMKAELVPPATSEIRQIIGITLEQAVAMLVKDDLNDRHIKKITALYQDAYRYRRENNLLQDALFPDTTHILKEIDCAGHLSAVATGKSWCGLKAEVERHKIKEYFVSLQCADFHPSKPHPSMIMAILEETGTRPQDAYMVGDSQYDMEMARAAGVMPIGVSWGAHDIDRLKDAGAKMIVNNMKDLEILL